VPPVVTYNTRLMAAVPNPFNPRTVIAFELERAGNASLQVFDVAGRLIETLVDGHREPGPYEVEWDGRDYSGQQVAAGVYFYRLQADYVRETRRMVLVK
jgi:flagellar hook assembly protein FlgD